MKTLVVVRNTTFLLFTLLITQTCLAQFENTIGNLAGSDETTDIKPLPNDHTAVLANTTSFGPQKILLMELDPLGHVVFFKTIFEVTNFAVEYTGTSLELDLNAAGDHVGYFIIGCKGSYPTQMILIRTDLSGTPTWARLMNNDSDPNSPISECGISLEKQPNRDVIVIGRSDQSGDLRYTASRFTPAGIMVWSNRYGSKKGLQFIPNESCNGQHGGQDVVTVVGHIHDAGIGHTFLSCIRASNGMEFWTEQYDSDHYHDDGTDLVKFPGSNRYMVVGHAEELLSPTKMWVFNVNGNNGKLLNGATYNLSAPFHNLFARDVCLSPDNISGTIAGFVDYETSFGSSEVRTFIMKLPFAPGALPVFSHYFTDSDPLLFLFGDDAIETIGGANPGYVLGTQAKLPGSALFDYDVHALRLNLSGMHNFTDCPVVPFTPEIVEEGTSSKLKNEKTGSTWSNFIIGAETQAFLENPCHDILPPPQINDMTIKSVSSIDTHIFPNPASAGSDVNIQFELLKPAEVKIQLIDVTGRICAQWSESRNEGNQLVQFPLPATLTDQMYLVRIVYSGGSYQVFRLLVD